MEDGRIAIFLPVRSPQGGLVGVAMILADIKSVGDGVVERIMTPQVRTIMQKVAVLLRPAVPRATQTDSLKILELAPEPAAPPVPAAPAKSAVSPLLPAMPATRSVPVKPAAPAGRAAPPVLTPQAVDDILEFELTPDLPSVAPRSQKPPVPALAAIKGLDLNLNLPTAKPVVPVVPVVPVARNNVAPVTAAPVVNSPGHSSPLASLAEAFDLDLPSFDPPVPTVFAGNVAPFPAGSVGPAGSAGLSGAAAAPTATSTPVGAIPTVGSAAALSSAAPAAAPAKSPPAVNGSAVAQEAPTGPAATASSVSSSSTTTSKALTGTTKAISAPDTSKSPGATSTSRVLALPEGFNLILEVLPFSKLRAGGRTRRYEVLARSSQPSRVPPAFDKFALQQLLAWMGTNRSAWSLEPTSFTLNLSIATLEDERFPQFVASNLKANGIAPDNIGFEIAEPLCLQRRAQVERFITLCDKLGCFVVIDDFSLDSSITGLLRSKALRLVKIDPKLTSVALKDKLAQAMVVAIAQAVKVLGIHCAAKRVESQAALQWLTAIGCDFAQGAALAQLQPLESLGTPPAPAP